MTTTADPWTRVADTIPKAHSLAWDGCHKIYLLMDSEQTDTMTEYGYRENDTPGGSQLHLLTELTDPLNTLRDWFDESCGLRFINAVHTVTGNPNDGFTTLIAQFEMEDEDEDSDFGDDSDQDDEDGDED